MPLLRLWAERSLGWRPWIYLLFELLLTALSGRAAWILLRDQTYFDRNPGPFVWLSYVTGREWRWGSLVGLGAVLVATGLLLMHRRSGWLQDTSFVLRQAGWACCTVFWCAFGASLLLWNPNAIAGWLAVTVGLIHAGTMVHGPYSRGDVDGG